MHELFAAFGIDWRLLLINLINFGLLLAVLRYFLYTPLMNTLESRRQKVIEGVENTHKAKQTLEEIEGSRAGLLAKAGRDADDVLAAAHAAGATKARELAEAGEARAAALLSEATAQAKELERQAVEAGKKEVAKLVVLGMDTLARKSS